MPRFSKEQLEAEVKEKCDSKKSEEERKKQEAGEDELRVNKMVPNILEELAKEMEWNDDKEIEGPIYSEKRLKSRNELISYGTSYTTKWILKFNLKNEAYKIEVIHVDRKVDSRLYPAKSKRYFYLGNEYVGGDLVDIGTVDNSEESLIELVTNKAKKILEKQIKK